MTLVPKYANPTRKSYMDSLVQQKVIKPSSRDWLTGALDPFHDFQFTPEGLPDQFSGSSVVQFIKRKVTIQPPEGLLATEKWDAHIFTAPLLTKHDAAPMAAGPGGMYNEDLMTCSLGTLNAFVVKSGLPTLPNALPSITTPFPGRQVLSPCDEGNTFSLMRLIGGGFEVHNDTAELYKNGSVTVYSQPSTIESDFGCVYAKDGATQLSNLGAFNKSRMPPSTIGEATANVNSTTWSAAEGCYVPFLLDVAKLDFSQSSAIPLVMVKVDNSDNYGAYPAWGIKTENGVPPPFIDGATVGQRAIEPVRLAHLETSGAYFTGLSPETILTLDVRFIVEVAPTAANTTLISLATPSSEYDPDALVLYSRACRELPAGVKVNMNAAGDWWRIVSGAIKFAAPVVAKLGPYGAGIAAAASGVSAIGDAAQEMRQQRKADKNAKKNGTQNSRSQLAVPKSKLNPNAKPFIMRK